MTSVRRIPGVEGALLESPVWCVETQRLWLVDIKAPAVLRYNPADGHVDRWEMPTDVGSLALTRRGDILVSLRQSISRFDPQTGRLTEIARASHDVATTRFNDGRCDHQGRFWVGTMYEPRTHAGGALYRLDVSGRLSMMQGGVTVANGSGFSPDGRIMYFADTPTMEVWASDLDLNTGALSNRRRFAKLTEAQGRPDGATVDSEGHYWVAAITGGQLLRYCPTGVLDRAVALPTKYPTMPAFGGRDLRTVYVTSLRYGRTPEELAASPESGGLFAFEADAPGLVEPRYAG
jgi:sugar lactone lactonase YvrE